MFTIIIIMSLTFATIAIRLDAHMAQEGLELSVQGIHSTETGGLEDYARP